MGTHGCTQRREYLNKPKDYTAISKKTGGNAGLGGEPLGDENFPQPRETLHRVP
jgi:hypothetical protein